MKNNHNLEIVLEILEEIETINTLIFKRDRETAVMDYNSLEKRIATLYRVHPKTHILSKTLDKIYDLHIGSLYHELEADIEEYEKKGYEITYGGNDE